MAMKCFRLDLVRLGLAFRLSNNPANITQCLSLSIKSKHLARTLAPFLQAIARQ